MSGELYYKLAQYNKPSNLITGFFRMNLNKKITSINSTAMDFGAGIRH